MKRSILSILVFGLLTGGAASADKPSFEARLDALHREYSDLPIQTPFVMYASQRRPISDYKPGEVYIAGAHMDETMGRVADLLSEARAAGDPRAYLALGQRLFIGHRWERDPIAGEAYHLQRLGHQFLREANQMTVGNDDALRGDFIALRKTLRYALDRLDKPFDGTHTYRYNLMRRLNYNSMLDHPPGPRMREKQTWWIVKKVRGY